jgi:hypothetical protein
MILSNTTFINNKVYNNSNFSVSGYGGAIYYTCTT